MSDFQVICLLLATLMFAPLLREKRVRAAHVDLTAGLAQNARGRGDRRAIVATQAAAGRGQAASGSWSHAGPLKRVRTEGLHIYRGNLRGHAPAPAKHVAAS